VTGLGERVRRRSDCEAVAGSLPAYVAGEGDLDERSARHVGSCLRCQADVARYRRMLRTLHALRDDTAEVPPGVLAGILSRLDGGAGRRASVLLDRWVAVGVAMAAGAAGAAGVLVWSSRRRAVS
jgi:anti-sigma factor RsiW